MQKRDFNDSTQQSSDSFYDLREDWILIESSLAKQYGIRIRNEKDMPWNEFSVLVSGLMHDTPLGQTVAIRAETDSTVISAFTTDQRRIYTAWQSKMAEKALENPEKLDRDMKNMATMLNNLFGPKEVKQSD